MPAPLATYRIQFRPSFGFRDATRLVPYLHGLGITHLYASPLFQARHDSQHGYDVTDPNQVNAQLGTEAELREMVAALHAHQMGLLLDIVPNHQAASSENPAWHSVLEHGPASPFARWFDIDWAADPDGKIRLPVLGAPLDQVVDRGELSLAFDDTGPYLRYFDARYPLSPSSWAQIIEAPDIEIHSAYVAAITAGLRDSAPDAATRLQADLLRAHAEDEHVREHIEKAISLYSPEVEGSRSRIEALLGMQHYRLLYWRAGVQTVNYRRFFDISDLVGIRQEDPRVFDETHRLLRDWIHEGLVNGVRVDHVDGLRDPATYIERLRGLWPDGVEPYIVVEKILGAGERLPGWPVAGTTGYDFLNDTVGLLVDPHGVTQHAARYQAFTGDTMAPADRTYEQKKEALRTLFPAEVDRLTRLLAEVAANGSSAVPPAEDLRRAIVELTACMPVYRTYVNAFPPDERDRETFESALSEARRRAPDLPPAALALLEQLFAGETSQPQGALEWVLRWQQLTGPAMAKGYEDTTLYRYVPLVAVNVVGSEPGSLEHPHDIATFHGRMAERAARWPGTLNTTATHDTKRGEDTRARLAALSEVPARWWDHVERWALRVAPHVSMVDGFAVPSRRDLVLFFQTIVGAWPPGMDLPDDDYRERIASYMLKAAREAGARTSWLDPHEAYEAALERFVLTVLDPNLSGPLLEEVRQFVEWLSPAGVANSLAQLVMKLVCPGVPDFYQGVEFWDLSLVDPDNRRPVDFPHRIAALDGVQAVPVVGHAALASELLASWPDGRVKLLVTERGLAARHRWPELFGRGEYVPGRAAGDRARHIAAAFRRLGARWVGAVIPRLASNLAPARAFPLGEAVWADTRLLLPEDAPVTWTNVLTGEQIAARIDGGSLRIAVGEALASLPVAILAGER